MTFQEVHASQFTRPTTCYTACRSGAGFFATETHSFSYDHEHTTVTAESLSSSRKRLCVGYDQSGTWELFCFLDPSLYKDEEAHHHVRSVSMSSSIPELLESSTTLVDAPIAWITLQCKETHTYVTPATAALTYRPLTPLLTTHKDEHSQVLAWVGSADDSKLRCYMVDHNNQTLLPVELSDSVFSFDSPVMAMDSLIAHNDDDNDTGVVCLVIAMGCQDGTIRVISFDYQRSGDDSVSFSHLTSYTVIVDGPIMALHLSQQKSSNGSTTTNLVVGSMCGFVCRLQQVNETSSWAGPWMVAEGLWNKDSEDAVLAVHMLPNKMVAFGTLSGCVHVWEPRQDDDSYRLLWQCQLPYSIHGVAHVPNSSPPALLVTTRYTFHVFHQDDCCPGYSASIVQRRLKDLMLLSGRKKITT
jgi:hypothetical protein